jgi:hypothetical protein
VPVGVLTTAQVPANPVSISAWQSELKVLVTGVVGVMKLLPAPVRTDPRPSVVDVVGPVEVVVDDVVEPGPVVDVVDVVDDVVGWVVVGWVLVGGAVVTEGRDVVGASVVCTTVVVVGAGRVVVDAGRVVVDAGRVVVGAGLVVGVVGRVVVGFGGAVVGATVVVVVEVEVVVDPGTAFGTLPRFGGGELGTGSVVADVDGRVGTVAKVPGTVVVVAAW